MQANDLIQHIRRSVRTTNSQHGFGRYPNLLQGCPVLRPDQVWCADITYIRLPHGFVYLAIVLDVFTRSLRAWYLGQRLNTELALRPLEQALQAHRARDPSLGSGHPVRRTGLCRPAAGRRRAGQHGRGRPAAPEPVCRAGDPHDQGRSGLLERLPHPGEAPRELARLHRRRLSDQAHPLGAGLSDARRVRSPMAATAPSRTSFRRGTRSEFIALQTVQFRMARGQSVRKANQSSHVRRVLPSAPSLRRRSGRSPAWPYPPSQARPV